MRVNLPLEVRQNESVVIYLRGIKNIFSPIAQILFQVKENSSSPKILISIEPLASDFGADWENEEIVIRIPPAVTRGLKASVYEWDLLVNRQGNFEYPYWGTFTLIGSISRNNESVDPVVINDLETRLAGTSMGRGSWMIGVFSNYWLTKLGSVTNLVLEKCLQWLDQNKLEILNPFTGSKLLKSGASALEVKESGIGIDSLDNVTGARTLSILLAPSDPSHATRMDWVVSEIVSRINLAVANLVNGAPGALDTLKELADAFGDDPNFRTTILNALAGKLSLSDIGNLVPSLVAGKIPLAFLPPTSSAPVTSVNTKIGDVVLNHSDVGAAPETGISPDAITETPSKQFISSGLKGFIDEFTLFSSIQRIDPSVSKPFLEISQDVFNGLDSNWPQLGSFLRSLKWGIGDPFGGGTYSESFQVTSVTKYDSNTTLELTLSGATVSSLLSDILNDLNYYAMFRSTDGLFPASVNASLLTDYGLVVRALTDIGNGVGKIPAGTEMFLKLTNGSIVNTLNPTSLKLGVGYSGGAGAIGTISGAFVEIFPYRRGVVSGISSTTSFRWRPVFDSVLRSRDTLAPGFSQRGRVLDMMQLHAHDVIDDYPLFQSGPLGGGFDYAVTYSYGDNTTTRTTTTPNAAGSSGQIRTGRKTQDRSLRVWMYLNAKEYHP